MTDSELVTLEAQLHMERLFKETERKLREALSYYNAFRPMDMPRLVLVKACDGCHEDYLGHMANDCYYETNWSPSGV